MATDAKKALTDGILSEADEKAKYILAEAEGYRKQRVEGAKKAAEEYVSEQRTAAFAAADDIAARKHTLALLEAKKQTLGAKQSVIDSVYNRAADMIKALPKAEYLAFVAKLIERFAEEGEMVVLAHNSPVTAADVAALKQISALQLKVEEGGKFDGGIMLCGKKCDKVLSVDALCAFMREQTEAEIAEKLFGND